jgi:hypothetical protein
MMFVRFLRLGATLAVLLSSVLVNLTGVLHMELLSLIIAGVQLEYSLRFLIARVSLGTLLWARSRAVFFV